MAHAHVPSQLHVPCPAQVSVLPPDVNVGQVEHAQSAPVRPGLHAHAPQLQQQ